MSSEHGDRRPPRVRRGGGHHDDPQAEPETPIDPGASLDPEAPMDPEAEAARADGGATATDGDRQRTRAEEMGIPPLWAISGGGPGKTRDLKRQLAAAEEALESARRDARDTNERYLRLAAEMENVQRRHRQDRQEQLLYGNAELISRILPVMDNFHRALEHSPESVEADPAVTQWMDGLKMVMRQFDDILDSMGVEAIESVGQQFDPNLHQAVMAEPSDQHADGEVMAELQRGYRLRDRILRPSMVKVASNN